jgi:hypothetical protein
MACYGIALLTLVVAVVGVHSALVRINEELLERKLVAPV